MYMRFLRANERSFAESVRRLALANPFGSERMELERAALGDRFSGASTAWSADGDRLPPPGAPERPNIALLRTESTALMDDCLSRLRRGVRPSADEARLYEDLALYALFARYESRLYALSLEDGPAGDRVDFYDEFASEFARCLEPSGARVPGVTAELSAPHLFSLFFQIRRAFHYIYRAIFGASTASVELRASVWESVFTRDLDRYRTHLHLRMKDIPTLVTGESGTGKDLVARAIGMSRYVPFDAKKKRFAVAFGQRYFAQSLSALAPGLIESELFGHRRGAFTGAAEDRAGFFEQCGEFGTVFLDEIGELSQGVQVKLLRVLQNRELLRVGEATPRAFEGKLVAATNRDLAAEVAAGRFREDLYYRLCADHIVTPTLRRRVASDERELERLVRVLARRVAGDELADALAGEVLQVIEEQLPRDHAWPGNVRELEQCVRSVLLRGSYAPLSLPSPAADAGALERALEASGLDAGELLARYSAIVYARTGSFVETGRRLGLDRRTVKEHVERAALLR
jgi:hypothetical protein